MSGFLLTPRFNDAFLFAADKHSRQTRKSTSIPYVAHLMSVAAIVLEAGGDEDMAIAALLHDVVEDCGGKPMLEEVRRRFGDRVAHIVEGCTDAYTDPKPPWRGRKEAYLQHLKMLMRTSAWFRQPTNCIMPAKFLRIIARAGNRSGTAFRAKGKVPSGTIALLRTNSAAKIIG